MNNVSAVELKRQGDLPWGCSSSYAGIGSYKLDGQSLSLHIVYLIDKDYNSG
jgi:hypothetical protein